MPAGDLITADWQIELRTTLMGAGTNYEFDPAGLAGFGVPPVKDADVDLDGAHGSYASQDFNGPRVITVSFDIAQTTAAAALTRLKELNVVWAPSTVDLPCHFRLPGWGRFSVVGRPRGLDEKLGQAEFGRVLAMATFVANDPTITYIP